jgi:lipid II isoglutaminyl synthase (glutamine-hydrolysing)
MARPSPAKLALARGVGAVSRLRGGGGTSAPGKLLMRLEPNAIGELGARLTEGSVLVSATNGKTTTATMAAAILERAGTRLVHNRAGANMAGGIATTLLAAARARGSIDGQLGLFEVDELWLDRLAQQLHPRAILLGNLFRDQLDRYGELETIAERWEQALQAHLGARLVLNADDPLVADLGRTLTGAPHDGGQAGEGGRAGILYFGVEDDSLALAGMAHAADAKHCRRCGAPYVFDTVYLGHLGHYHCPSCGQTRPRPTISASDVRLRGVRSASFTLHTPAGQAEISLELPGLYNVYNALAAAALATALEVPLEQIASGLRQTRAAFGRAESVTLYVPRRGGADSADVADEPVERELRILLVKNPAGANEVLRTLALEPGEHDLLGVLNDRIADGRDVSWIWDADFELLAGRVRRATCAGTRAADLAARLKYAGVEPSRIDVREQLADALDAAAVDRPTGADAGAASGGPAGNDALERATPPLFALPTYTAMLELRELLVARGQATSAWS